MTQKLLEKTVKKKLFHVKWNTTPVTHASYNNVKESFKNCGREILKQIQVANHDHFNRIFTAYETDMKKTWRYTNETLSRNKKTCDLPPTFFHNGRTETETLKAMDNLENRITRDMMVYLTNCRN